MKGCYRRRKSSINVNTFQRYFQLHHFKWPLTKRSSHHDGRLEALTKQVPFFRIKMGSRCPLNVVQILHAPHILLYAMHGTVPSTAPPKSQKHGRASPMILFYSESQKSCHSYLCVTMSWWKTASSLGSVQGGLIFSHIDLHLPRYKNKFLVLGQFAWSWKTYLVLIFIFFALVIYSRYGTARLWATVRRTGEW